MLTATVIGNVWATRRLTGLPSGAFLEVEAEGSGQRLIAFDVLGSGVGERVLVAQGSVAAAWFAGKPPLASPFYGVTEDMCYDDDMEIIVLLSGTDETFSSVIYARHSYQAEDILFDRKFVDVLTRAQSGRLEVDLGRFHDTESSIAAS